jgi:hypothetical protein
MIRTLKGRTETALELVQSGMVGNTVPNPGNPDSLLFDSRIRIHYNMLRI